jgi:hypothetical protein
MPMSDGLNTLHKIAFQIGDDLFKFAINPESITNPRPHRVVTTKTKSRIVVSDFQSDIPTFVISGTTGFNPTGKADDRGIAKIKRLKLLIENYAEMGGDGSQPPVDFIFYDFTNDASWIVHLAPEGVTYSQDVSNPLLHRYEIKFTVLRQAAEPAEEDKINPEIGNRFPSIPRENGFEDPIYGDIYNKDTTGTGEGSTFTEGATNPQAPSTESYIKGLAGLGFAIGHYLRGFYY